jgi:hypothetical protein
MSYRVLVDDHAHYMDDSHRREHGAFATAAEAIAACRTFVDAELQHFLKPGMTAAELFEMYSLFGEDPFIVPVGEGAAPVDFSAWDYAKQQSKVLTSKHDSSGSS